MAERHVPNHTAQNRQLPLGLDSLREELHHAFKGFVPEGKSRQTSLVQTVEPDRVFLRGDLLGREQGLSPLLPDHGPDLGPDRRLRT